MAAIVLLLARGGFTAAEAVLIALALVPPATLLFFDQARTTRARGVPIMLWRLRETVGALRGVAGIALPLRVL